MTLQLPGRDVAILWGIALLVELAVSAALGAPGSLAPDAPERVGDAFFGAASLVVLASLAARIFRSRGAGWTAAGLGAAGLLIRSRSGGTASGPMILLLAVAGFLLLVTVDRPSSGCGVAAGAALGGAVLIRPAAGILAVLLLSPLLDRRFPEPIRRALAGSALFGLAAVVAAGCVRNDMGGGIGHAGWVGVGVARPGAGAFENSSPATISFASLIGLGVVVAAGAFGWFKAERRGVRLVALAALGLALSVSAAGRAHGLGVPLAVMVLTLYAAGGIARVARLE